MESPSSGTPAEVCAKFDRKPSTCQTAQTTFSVISSPTMPSSPPSPSSTCEFNNTFSKNASDKVLQKQEQAKEEEKTKEEKEKLELIGQEEKKSSSEEARGGDVKAEIDIAGEKEDDEKEKARLRFRLYWECAKEKFGVSDDGMLLKREVKTDGFADADKFEIINILYTYMDESKFDYPVERILEIGAGIGRLTKCLQGLCKEITAVDFIEEYIIKNKEQHYDEKNRKNDKFVCMDALKLNYEEGTFDIIFWNWLLMYFSNDECYFFVKKMFNFLKKGGLLFCRESCGEPSDKQTKRDWAVGGNPTNYRNKEFYTQLFTDYVPNQLGVEVFMIMQEIPIRVYMDKVGTQEQRIWLLKKL